MDTIIYIYRKRGLQEPEVEPVGLKRYMLIRVGLDVREDEWFGLDLGLPERPPEAMTGRNPEEGLQGREGPTLQGKLLPPLKGLLLRRMRRRNRRLEEQRRRRAEQEYLCLLGERRERIRQADRVLGRLAGEVLELTEDRRDCRLVYEGTVRKALVGSRKNGGAPEGCFVPEQHGPTSGQEREDHRPAWQEREDHWAAWQEREDRWAAWQEREDHRPAWQEREECWPAWQEDREPWREQNPREREDIPRGQTLWELWNSHFDLEEFQDYTQRFWADRLLPYARLYHYVILGTAPCVFGIIEEHARRMKSLRWMLLEKDCDQRLQDFAEDFYTEYGLAIELRLFESPEALKRLRPLCSRPSNIIDFTGAVWPFMTEAAEGSVWLDMLSSEEKRYRLQRHGARVEYVSLKEEWKRAKRRCHAPE